MKRALLTLVVLPFAALAGCSGANGEPCTGEFTYSNGSMPPPHSYEWTVSIDEGAGTIVWTSPYASPQPDWSAEFVPGAAAVVALCDAIREAPERGEGVGGEVATWELSTGSGSTDGEVGTLAAAAIDLVGRDKYDELHEQYTQWKSEQD